MKKSLLLVTILFFSLIGHSTVMGSLTIEFVGYDIEKNIVYLARTDWAECDCDTELYIYHINQDSIEIVKNWSGRNNFRLRRQTVLAEKGLENLLSIDSTSLVTTEYIFKWLPKTDYYSRVMGMDTVNCPFTIQISETNYNFVQCYSQKKNPEIKEYSINQSIGFLHIRYTGDCYEGNFRDELILIKKNSEELESRLLISSNIPK
jgi:hypothetical protein